MSDLIDNDIEDIEEDIDDNDNDIIYNKLYEIYSEMIETNFNKNKINFVPTKQEISLKMMQICINESLMFPSRQDGQQMVYDIYFRCIPKHDLMKNVQYYI